MIRLIAWLRLAAIVAVLFALTTDRVYASTLQWSGGGATDQWSDPANWIGGIVPAGGDDVLFGVSAGDSFNNLAALSLASFRFDAAVLPLHNIHISGGASLSLNAAGIDNDSKFQSGGVIRQQFFADGASTAGGLGGRLVFQNSATIGGNLPVDLTALGGTAVGAGGGRIVFEGNSTASSVTEPVFTVLFVKGAAVAGADGGELRFQDDAWMGYSANYGNGAGQVAGAAGGVIVFEDRAVASGNANNLTGVGLGGRVYFRDHATTYININLSNDGATNLHLGAEAVTQFLDDSVLVGTVQNFAGQDAGMAGGRLEFRNRARFDGTSIPPELGSIQILNRGAFNRGEGGRTVFYDDARIVGTNVYISNSAESEGSYPDSSGGVTEFLGNSRAGNVQIGNSGANSGSGGTLGGRTIFRDNSSAENAVVTSGGGFVSGAVGGSVEFSGSSTAANATLTTLGGFGGLGGKIVFVERASGAAARVTLNGDGMFDMSGLTTSGTTLGSIEGGGAFFLGSKALAVGSTGLNTEVAGVISDGGQAGGAGAALTKVGAGTLVLSGANTFTGTTTVSAGTLIVDGSLGSAPVTVASLATLGGTGTIGGSVTVASGGAVAPGKAGAGTLSVGALTLGASSNLNFDLGSLSDRLEVNGALTLDGILNIAAPTGLTLGTYRLINYTGAFTDDGLTFGTVPAGTTVGNFTLQTNTPGQVNLILGGNTDVLFWDGLQTTPNNAVNGGAGAWNNALTNWTNSAGSVQRAWNGRTAVFSGAAGTVTVAENVSTQGLQFATSGYTVNANPGLNITLDGVVPVRVDAGAATINAGLAGAGSLNKTGNGSLTLTASSSYTGGTTVTDGVLVVANAAGLGLGAGPVSVLESLSGVLRFAGAGSAGTVTITNSGSGGSLNPGFTLLIDSATASTATITNQGNSAVMGTGGVVLFSGTSRAGSATINNLGAGFSGPGGGFVTSGQTQFRGTTAEAAAITNFAGPGAGLRGGNTLFSDGALGVGGSAGNATIANRGGAVAGAIGGSTQFSTNSTAGNATLTAEGGTNGGLGGSIVFTASSNGSNARVVLGAGDVNHGTLDIRALASAGTSIGSLEGDGGVVLLGAKTLSIGGNNQTTEFDGVIDDDGLGGRLFKFGTGMLTLRGDNSYTGDTHVLDGVLRVDNPSGLALGSLGVVVHASPTSELRFSFGSSAGASSIINSGGAFGDAGLTTFRSSATAGTATILNNPSLGPGAHGGVTEFYATSRAGNATIDNRAGSFIGGPGGIGGGDLNFRESSNADSAMLDNRGAFAFNAEGGQTNFFNSSSGGNATITNHAAVLSGAFPGATVFRDSATASSAAILNRGSALIGASSGVTEFFDSSRAGAATIANAAGTFAEAPGGTAIFHGMSLAGTARITNAGATTAKAFGGSVVFDFGAGSAEGATIVNQGATTNQGPTGNALQLSGGFAQFFPGTSAGMATITNEGGLANGAVGGFTEFGSGSTAAQATVLNRRGTVAGALGGFVRFNGGTGGAATFTNEGAQFSGQTFGITEFRGSANGGSGISTNRGGQGGFMLGGGTHFYETAKAGSRQISNEGGMVANGRAGGLLFFGSSDAEDATIINRGSTAAGAAEGGVTLFFASSLAGSATIINEGSAFNALGTTPSGGRTHFLNGASAGQATISNRAATSGASGAGVTFFFGDIVGQVVTADRATITNDGGKFPNGFSGYGRTEFSGEATAGSAVILNAASEVAAALGGVTFFNAGSSAGAASITNAGAIGPNCFYGVTIFQPMSTAGSATIVNAAGTENAARGGVTSIIGASTAGTATIVNRGGNVPGAHGGVIALHGTATTAGSTIRSEGGIVSGAGSGQARFVASTTAGQSTLVGSQGVAGAAGGGFVFGDTSDGGTARAILEGDGDRSAGLDISQLTDAGMSIGSIEGGGIVRLGRRNLAVGGNNLNTTFAGIVRDGGIINETGGSLTKVGPGKLTLAGANTYTGLTTIQGGTLAVNGSIPGDALVRNGGTLGGTGTIGGNTTVLAGGRIEPGNSPGTLTIGGDFTQELGSLLGIEIAGAAPGTLHDVLRVTGNTTLGGDLLLEFIDGFAPRQGDAFEFLDVGGTVAGSFANVQLRNLAPGFLFDLRPDGGGMTMVALNDGDFVAPPLSNWNVDANGNWSSAANWTIAVPNATGAAAAFGSKITGPRIVTADVPITVGRVNFDSDNAYTIAGSNTITLNATSGDAQINVTSGSHSISAPVSQADNTVITVSPVASNLSITGALSASGLNLTKAGAGSLTLNNLRAAGLSISGGKLVIAPNGLGAPAGTLVLGSLTIAGANDAWTAKLDLSDNDAVVASTAANKAADFVRLYNQLKHGFDGGNWSGNGITSATAAANSSADTTLTLVDNALLGYTDFSGQSVTANSILLKYTYYGDIDANGAVDADDLTVFANNFGRTAGASQIDGDIDFNGAVDADDLTVFANNFGNGIGNPLIAAAVQAVPEPSTWLLAALGVASVLITLRITKYASSRASGTE